MNVLFTFIFISFLSNMCSFFQAVEEAFVPVIKMIFDGIEVGISSTLHV